MLATFAASLDKPGVLALVGILVASGVPIGETDGTCGGGSAAPGDPAGFCVPALVGVGALGTLESGGTPLAVGVLGDVAVGIRVLGALGDALGAFAALDAGLLGVALGLPLGALGALLAGALLVGAPPPGGGTGLGFLGRVPPLGGLPPAPAPRRA